MSEFQVFSSYYQAGSRAATQLIVKGGSGRSEVPPIDPDDPVIRFLGWFIINLIERPLLWAYWRYMAFLGLD
jgi:hypothetical protein